MGFSVLQTWLALGGAAVRGDKRPSKERLWRDSVLVILVALGGAACGGETRFPLREPLWRDPDQVPFVGEPEEYVSPFGWDAADQMVFRPVARFFAVDPAGRALN